MTESDHGDQAFRAGTLTGRRREMTYGGALSFLRRKYTRDIHDKCQFPPATPSACVSPQPPG